MNFFFGSMINKMYSVWINLIFCLEYSKWLKLFCNPNQLMRLKLFLLKYSSGHYCCATEKKARPGPRAIMTLCSHCLLLLTRPPSPPATGLGSAPALALARSPILRPNWALIIQSTGVLSHMRKPPSKTKKLRILCDYLFSEYEKVLDSPTTHFFSVDPSTKKSIISRIVVTMPNTPKRAPPPPSPRPEAPSLRSLLDTTDEEEDSIESPEDVDVAPVTVSVSVATSPRPVSEPPPPGTSSVIQNCESEDDEAEEDVTRVPELTEIIERGRAKVDLVGLTGLGLPRLRDLHPLQDKRFHEGTEFDMVEMTSVLMGLERRHKSKMPSKRRIKIHHSRIVNLAVQLAADKSPTNIAVLMWAAVSGMRGEAHQAMMEAIAAKYRLYSEERGSKSILILYRVFICILSLLHILQNDISAPANQQPPIVSSPVYKQVTYMDPEAILPDIDEGTEAGGDITDPFQMMDQDQSQLRVTAAIAPHPRGHDERHGDARDGGDPGAAARRSLQQQLASLPGALPPHLVGGAPQQHLPGALPPHLVSGAPQQHLPGGVPQQHLAFTPVITPEGAHTVYPAIGQPAHVPARPPRPIRPVGAECTPQVSWHQPQGPAPQLQPQAPGTRGVCVINFPLSGLQLITSSEDIFGMARTPDGEVWRLEDDLNPTGHPAGGVSAEGVPHSAVITDNSRSNFPATPWATGSIGYIPPPESRTPFSDYMSDRPLARPPGDRNTHWTFSNKGTNIVVFTHDAVAQQRVLFSCGYALSSRQTSLWLDFNFKLIFSYAKRLNTERLMEAFNQIPVEFKEAQRRQMVAVANFLEHPIFAKPRQRFFHTFYGGKFTAMSLAIGDCRTMTAKAYLAPHWPYKTAPAP